METRESHSLRAAVASVLRSERGRLHISQDVLAERAGISKSVVTRAERCVRDLDTDQLAKIAAVFGRKVSYLFLRFEEEVTLQSEAKAAFGPGDEDALRQMVEDAPKSKRKRS